MMNRIEIGYPFLIFLLTACGGSTIVPEDDDPGLPCQGVIAPATAIAVVDGIRCSSAVPSSAKLVHLRSGPQGTMDAQGRELSWTLFFWDAGTKLRYVGGSSQQGDEMVPEFIPDDSVLDCDASDELVQIDTSVVVPDALSRAPADKPMANVFVFEYAECFDWAPETERHLVEISHQSGEHSYVFYDRNGQFQRYCGPCGPDQSSPTKCQQCVY